MNNIIKKPKSIIKDSINNNNRNIITILVIIIFMFSFFPPLLYILFGYDMLGEIICIDYKYSQVFYYLGVFNDDTIVGLLFGLLFGLCFLISLSAIINILKIGETLKGQIIHSIFFPLILLFIPLFSINIISPYFNDLIHDIENNNRNIAEISYMINNTPPQNIIWRDDIMTDKKDIQKSIENVYNKLLSINNIERDISYKIQKIIEINTTYNQELKHILENNNKIKYLDITKDISIHQKSDGDINYIIITNKLEKEEKVFIMELNTTSRRDINIQKELDEFKDTKIGDRFNIHGINTDRYLGYIQDADNIDNIYNTLKDISLPHIKLKGLDINIYKLILKNTEIYIYLIIFFILMITLIVLHCMNNFFKKSFGCKYGEDSKSINKI